MFYMPLGEYWLGPTRYTWADNQCGTLQFDNGTEESLRDDVGACKETCEQTESCNAIAVKDANLQIYCDLRSCPIPIPAPAGQPWGDVKGCGGYYRATGTNAKDM